MDNDLKTVLDAYAALTEKMATRLDVLSERIHFLEGTTKALFDLILLNDDASDLKAVSRGMEVVDDHVSWYFEWLLAQAPAWKGFTDAKPRGLAL